MLELAFWICVVGAGWSYFLYPLVLWLQVSARRTAEVLLSTGDSPAVSLIVTVHNEAARLPGKLQNIAALDYPREKLQIIVASDCSSDGTDGIAEAAEGVHLVRATQRLGKEHAQQCAIAEATGQILVFSDVATEMPPDALSRLVTWFRDPAVGAVSSEDRFLSKDGSVAGEGLYVRYEMWLRRLESRMAGLVGLSGSFFAARREVCARWDIHSPSDFNTALNCAALGFRAITAPDVLGYYEDLKDPSREYARKVRTALRGMTGLARHAEVLDPRRFGQFAFQVISHKLMRWLVPVFLCALLPLNYAVRHEGLVFQLALLAQVAFYAVAIAAHLSPPLRSIGLVRLVYFFVQVNIALADAMFRFLRGTRMTVWQPSAR